MVSSEVQRTLVKSPPELWAELSDPDALARHLGELGEIHITHTVPETTVEWETVTGNAQGKVTLAPSGWGTKVTLTVAREAAESEPPVEPEAVVVDEPAPEPEPLAVAETEPAIAQEPQPRPGFFARLFRRRKEILQPGPEPEQPAVIEIDEPEQPQDEETSDIAAELKAAEEVAAEQVTAVLTAVLDRLGAAHHRPFSRA
jgi:hypothetical protein